MNTSKTKRLFIDVETTGTNSKLNAIHQLSGIIEIDGIIAEMFDYKIIPFEGALIEQEALEVSHITLEKLNSSEYRPESECYYEFKNLLSFYVKTFDKKDKFHFIGFNSKFDKDFCYEMFKRQNDDFFMSLIYGNDIDVMVLASDFLEDERSEMENFQLITVAKKLGIDIDEDNLHNSAYDIEITRLIFHKLRELRNNSNIEIDIYSNNRKNELDELFPYPPMTQIISQEEIEAARKDQSELDIHNSIRNEFDPDESEESFEPKIIQPLIKEKPKMSIPISDFLNPTHAKPIDTGKGTPIKSLIKINDLNYCMTFGKYKDWSFEDILKENPGYIIWLNDNHIQGIVVSKEIIDIAIKKQNAYQSSKDYNKEYYSKPRKDGFKNGFEDIDKMGPSDGFFGIEATDDLPF